METDREMHDGLRVAVRLHGDDRWFHGVVVRARKQWVELSDFVDSSGKAVPFIADENNIAEWKEVA